MRISAISFKESSLAEAERLNVLLPLIKWEVDNNDLSEAMSDEFYLYYEDLLKGSVTDNIGTVGEILLRDGRFGQTTGMGVVHSDEMVGLSRGNTGVGKSEGTNRANPLVHNGFARFSLCQ